MIDRSEKGVTSVTLLVINDLVRNIFGYTPVTCFRYSVFPGLHGLFARESDVPITRDSIASCRALGSFEPSQVPHCFQLNTDCRLGVVITTSNPNGIER